MQFRTLVAIEGLKENFRKAVLEALPTSPLQEQVVQKVWAALDAAAELVEDDAKNARSQAFFDSVACDVRFRGELMVAMGRAYEVCRDQFRLGTSPDKFEELFAPCTAAFRSLVSAAGSRRREDDTVDWTLKTKAGRIALAKEFLESCRRGDTFPQAAFLDQLLSLRLVQYEDIGTTPEELKQFVAKNG